MQILRSQFSETKEPYEIYIKVFKYVKKLNT